MRSADFERLISTLDLELFAQITSQTSPHQKESMLACQLATRELTNGYGYLEIGSYLGGSIQSHLVDPLCEYICSIDKRPAKQPDNRGITYKYKDNSTERMLGMLAEVEGGDLDKLVCLEGDTVSVRPEQVERPVQLCLIDAEHTDDAVVRDFEFCLRVMDGNGAVLFDDAQIVFNGLAEAIERLKQRGQAFHAYHLADALMVIEIGDFPLHEHPKIAERLLDNYVGYLASLQATEYFRRWANVFPVRAVRVLRDRVKGTDTCR